MIRPSSCRTSFARETRDRREGEDPPGTDRAVRCDRPDPREIEAETRTTGLSALAGPSTSAHSMGPERLTPPSPDRITPAARVYQPAARHPRGCPAAPSASHAVLLSGAVPQRTWKKLNMHRVSTSLLGLSVLVVVSCGAPAELDESLFPGQNETGYADGDATGSTGAPSVPLGGAAGQPSSSGGTGTAVVPSPGGAGGASSLTGGAAGAPIASGGSAQSGTAGGANTLPMGGGSSAGGCPDDITVLFARPVTEGGCGDNGCHVPQGFAPDLVSPSPEMRLLNVASQCGGRPYVGAGDSFLAEKISGETPECGAPMPFLQPGALNDADRACILQWIDEVSGG